MTSESRTLWQKQTEDAMFSRSIRSDLMDEEDMEDALADQRLVSLLAGETVDFSAPLLETSESKVMQIDEINSRFNGLVTEISEKLRVALEQAGTESRYIKADVSLRSISVYDRAGKCPNCSEYFPMNNISNNKKLVNQVNREWKALANTYGIKLDTTDRLFSKGEKSGKIEPSWDIFRNGLNSVEEINFTQKNGRMKRKELLALNKVNSDWAKVAAGLILCSRRSLSCTNLDCGEGPEDRDLWTHTGSTERPFHRVSYLATKVILEETVGSAVTRAPKYIIGKDKSGKPIKIHMGNIAGHGGKTNKRLLAEAVLTATRVLGDLELSSASESYSISEAEGEKSRVYVSVNHSIVTKLASLIERIRPIESFIREGRDVSDHREWAATCAGQVLHAIHQSGLLFSVEKTRDFSYQSGKNSKYATNLIRINDNIRDRILEDFNSEMIDGSTYNSLESLLSKETTPPMICKPEDREEREDSKDGEGGLLTRAGQKRYKMITQEPQYKVFRTDRFHPSEEGIYALNVLQSTQWAVDPKMVEIAENTIKNFVSTEILSNLDIRYNEEFDRYYVDFNGSKPKVTFSQVSSWLNTFAFITRLGDRYPDMNFWHAWQFDWRGRMITASTMLSPQNDDFSRGLITFANPKKLTASGRKWIGRVIASMYKDQPIPKSFNAADTEALEELLSKLKPKTYEYFDEVSSNELFNKMLRVIADNPEENFSSWGEGDVFRSKATGFQRLALTREFVSILDQGEDAESSLPINLDASSSIYQHASALMLDADMASKVNVLPNQTGGPSDVYQEVVDDLAKEWAENPFAKMQFPHKTESDKKETIEVEGLSDETSKKLLSKILVRSMAKGPVMTIGYGASVGAMVNSLLTDNGKDSGRFGGRIAYSIGNDWPKVIEDVKDLSESTYHIFYHAHPASQLGLIFGELEIPEHFHWMIAQKVINGYKNSIENVLPSYKMMKEALSSTSKAHFKTHFDNCNICQMEWANSINIETNHILKKGKTQCECFVDGVRGQEGKQSSEKTLCDNKKMLKSFFATSRFLKCSGGLGWTVKDGCTIENIKLKGSEMDSIAAWGGISATQTTMRKIARDKLTDEMKSAIPVDNLEMVDFSKLSSEVLGNTYDDLHNHESNKLKSIYTALENSDYSTDSVDMENLVIDWEKLANVIDAGSSVDEILASEPDKDNKDVIKAVREYSGTFNTHFSRQIMSNERDINGENRGIAPNFIHSLDACHMRMVIRRLSLNEITDVWSVHDAFGCHPNHIELLRNIVNKTFGMVHELNDQQRGILTQLYHNNLGKDLPVGTMNIDDVAKSEDGELVSKYLIS